MKTFHLKLKKYLIRKMFVKDSKNKMKMLIRSPSGLVFFDDNGNEELLEKNFSPGNEYSFDSLES